MINGYLLEEFSEAPLEAITPDAIDAYKERLIAGGKLSNRTIVRHLTVLHGVFKRAKRVWGLASNPASAELVERPKVAYTREFDTLDRDELERLATAAESTQDAALYKIAAFTGLRQGELLALRWENVDFAGGLLHVRRNYTGGREKVPKGKRVRSVPLMPEAIEGAPGAPDSSELHGRSGSRFLRDDWWAPRPLRPAASLLLGAGEGGSSADPIPRSSSRVRHCGDHQARPACGPVLHGPPALLDDAALPPSQAPPRGRRGAAGGIRPGHLKPEVERFAVSRDQVGYRSS